MGILQKSYSLVCAAAVDVNNPVLVPLNRLSANELVLLSVLVPKYLDEVFCSDASMTHGAICSTRVSPEASELLWKSCRTKGAYTRMQSPAESMLERMEIREPGLLEDVECGPDRPFGLRYDFVEVFAGSSRVSHEVALLGYSVCLPVDISVSEELNVAWLHVASWLSFMISEERVKAFIAEPPCATFSIMRRPALRSVLQPFGFDPSEPQTQIGNVLAHRGFQLLAVGRVNEVTGLLETPWTSKMRKLFSWRNIEDHPTGSSCRTDSCAFGSPHLKSFCFLGVWADLHRLEKRCTQDHQHVHVQGKYTKESAVYPWELARALAQTLVDGIERKRQSVKPLDELNVKGLEFQLVNEVACGSQWRKVSSWPHKKLTHINLLELKSVYHLAYKLVTDVKTSCRPVCLVDSNVIRCAASKGRTSSRCLTSLLRKFAVLCLVGGLYFCLPFCPTRHNPSDDPTRGAELRSRSASLGLESWTYEDLYMLALLPRTRRWAANWARLCLLLAGSLLLHLSDRSKFRSSSYSFQPLLSNNQGLVNDKVGYEPPTSVFDFDSTLGFPGEGPPGFRQSFSHACAVVLDWWLALSGCASLVFSQASHCLKEQISTNSFLPAPQSDDVAYFRPCEKGPYGTRRGPRIIDGFPVGSHLSSVSHFDESHAHVLVSRGTRSGHVLVSSPGFWTFPPWLVAHHGEHVSFPARHLALDFSSALSLDFDQGLAPAVGFLLSGRSRGVFLSSLSVPSRSLSFLFLAAAFFNPAAAMMFPRNAGDRLRQLNRAGRPELPEGRPVLQITSSNRDKLLSQFWRWLQSIGVDPEVLFEEPQLHLQQLNNLLTRFGRQLYASGRPYNHFAETLNAVSAYRPVVKRSLQRAWDLGFAWVREERPEHHLSMPWQILLAMLTTSLLWGWASVSGGIALCFGALLRPGEFLAARRADLLLPGDVANTNHLLCFP